MRKDSVLKARSAEVRFTLLAGLTREVALWVKDKASSHLVDQIEHVTLLVEGDDFKALGDLVHQRILHSIDADLEDTAFERVDDLVEGIHEYDLPSSEVNLRLQLDSVDPVV